MILRVDIDAGRRLLTVHRMMWLLRRAGYRLRWVSQVRSPSGTGWHLEARVSPAPTRAVEVVALQALLGSDPAREACNLQRARLVDSGKISEFWRKRWNVLYSSRGR